MEERSIITAVHTEERRVMDSESEHTAETDIVDYTYSSGGHINPISDIAAEVYASIAVCNIERR